MYRRPPLFLTVGFSITNASGNTTILVAPGANLRYRIVGFHVGFRRTVAAGIADVIPQDGTGGAGFGVIGLDVAGMRTFALPIPEPGVVLTENTLFNLNHIASVAGPLSAFCGVFYYIDDFS